MTSKMKILGIALVVMAVTVLLVYVPFALANSQNNRRNWPKNVPMTIEEIPDSQFADGFRQRLLRRFIENSTLAEIQGTVVASVRNLLVLDTQDGQVRIHLPRTWIVNGEKFEKEDLFGKGYLTIEQSITVKALKGTLVTKDTYSIYVVLGYEIVNASSVHAYAVLPFNIQIP
jgi:hypothetical protein